MENGLPHFTTTRIAKPERPTPFSWGENGNEMSAGAIYSWVLRGIVGATSSWATDDSWQPDRQS